MKEVMVDIPTIDVDVELARIGIDVEVAVAGPPGPVGPPGPIADTSGLATKEYVDSRTPQITVGTTAPSSPAINDVWIDTN